MRNTTLVNAVSIAIFGFAIAASPLNAAEHEQGGHAHKEAHADHMLEGCNVVATALYKDDLATAKKAAAGIVKHDKNVNNARIDEG